MEQLSYRKLQAVVRHLKDKVLVLEQKIQVYQNGITILAKECVKQDNLAKTEILWEHDGYTCLLWDKKPFVVPTEWYRTVTER